MRSRSRCRAIRRCSLELSRRGAGPTHTVGIAARPVPSAQHALDTPSHELDTFSSRLDTDAPAVELARAQRGRPQRRVPARRSKPSAVTTRRPGALPEVLQPPGVFQVPSPVPASPGRHPRLHVHRVDHAAQCLRFVCSHLTGTADDRPWRAVRLREQRQDLPEQGPCLEHSLFQLIHVSAASSTFFPI